jgi:hypothetical protein
MSEPTKESPKAPKRSRRKPAMEPLGWDEIVSQPGMGGYLSFLNGPVPLPHLQTPGASPDPGVVSPPAVHSGPAIPTTPAQLDTASDVLPTPEAVPGPAVVSDPGIITTPGPLPDVSSTPEVISSPVAVPTAASPEPTAPSTPGVVSRPAFQPNPGAATSMAAEIQGIQMAAATPGVERIPAVAAQTAQTRPGVASAPVIAPMPGVPLVPPGRIRIRRCTAARDGHSLGEEVLYQALWKAAAPESSDTRILVIGWRGMSQLCRMTPKNCKINTQRLIRKLALEVLSPYNTPESIGTTYRIYSNEAILARRGAAGMQWVVRSRGVEFVDPATGQPHTAHLCTYASERAGAVSS